MTNMRIDLEELYAYLGKRVGLERLKESISMMGTDLDSIEDGEILVEIFPNRPDLLSFAGFARALAAFLDLKPGLRLYPTKADPSYRVIIDKSAAEVRPYTACAIVKKLSLDDQKIKDLIDIQEKLHTSFGRERRRVAIGVYPLEKITLPITYTARKPEEIRFLPLEADHEMTGTEILEHHPTGKVYAHLLEGAKMYPVFVDAKGEILSMPPIINSQRTGRVTEETEELFVECSGHSMHVVGQALAMLTTALADMGGEVYRMELSYPDGKVITPDLATRTIEVQLPYVEKVIGVPITKVGDLLSRMGMNLREKDGDTLTVEYPPYRTDILHPVDIIEDIAIAYGYNNIAPELPSIFTVGAEHPLEVFKRRVASLLTGLGFLEIASYQLTTKETQEKAGTKAALEVEDARTEYRVLRQSLLPSLLQAYGENTHREYPQRLFELGFVFSEDKRAEQRVVDHERLSIGIAPGNYTDIRQAVEYCCAQLGVATSYREWQGTPFLSGRAAVLEAGGKAIATLGEIAPDVLGRFGIEMPLACAEMDVEALFSLVRDA